MGLWLATMVRQPAETGLKWAVSAAPQLPEFGARSTYRQKS
jgi:hypothetical protein